MPLDDYVWSAGVATELVNTTAEVWHGDDHLPDLVALVAFAELHAPDAELPELARRARAADLRAVWALRVTLRDLLDRPERDNLIAGAGELTSVACGATLVADPAHAGRTRWALGLNSGATIRDALALVCGVGVLGVVHTLGEQRFRQCGASTCRGAFIDTTRPGRRRYCMPGLCGNRTNVANHRARRAAARQAGQLTVR
ncbi:CGNR zinc finger domain-containing protein [Pseudonocardia spinosispora]|uniref:CGNR zinc finger domain-containing protein n=1 Tax=Pseudonocardia spinosispora TaxID=103441 RepID=UPI0005671A25